MKPMPLENKPRVSTIYRTSALRIVGSALSLSSSSSVCCRSGRYPHANSATTNGWVQSWSLPIKCCQLCFKSSLPKHFHPDGCVDEDHRASTRRLRTSLIFGAVPASARSLRPASLAMIDLRASRISSALSFNPVYSCALFSRSSSSVTDALIALPLYTNHSTAMHRVVVVMGWRFITGWAQTRQEMAFYGTAEQAAEKCGTGQERRTAGAKEFA